MSLVIKLILSGSLVAVPYAAAGEPLCKSGLAGISVIEGPNQYGDQPPDSESLKPTGKWPENLIEQGWHNLRKSKRPLRVACRYADGTSEMITLPDTVDTCILKPGLVATCK